MRRILLGMCAVLLLAQVGFRTYPNEEDDEAPVPLGANDRAEYSFARLRYPSFVWGGARYLSWGTDYPKADRQFVLGVKRLTRIDACSAERVIDLDTDEIYHWPWVYAVEVGHWQLTDAQCKRVREYLLRGGFLIVDDFHGTLEWEVFVASMGRIFPDRQIIEIDDADSIFHVVYDLDHREQVPGLQFLRSGRTYERDGVVPHWRGIYDDQGRLMVAICFNQDNGDAWEWADLPAYPERYASQAYRLGVNTIVYAMTH